MCPRLHTLNSKPNTLHKPLNPKTLNPKPYSQPLNPSTLNPKTLNP